MYIASTAHISLQQPLSEAWMINPFTFEPLSYQRAVEPEMSPWITAMSARRMSPIIKRAIVTAKIALERANLQNIEAIICGTGLGCVENTEKFLEMMMRQGEEYLQPAYFTLSTHNTIASQIALDEHRCCCSHDIQS